MPELDLTTALAELIQRLVVLASRDEQLLSCFRALAEQILAATREAGAGRREPSGIPDGADVEVSAQETPIAPPSTPAELSPRILEGLEEAVASMGGGTPAQVAEATPVRAAAGPEDADLANIEARCRMKAEGARWAATRQQQLAGGVDFETEIQPLDREIIAKAKRLPDCFLWMNHSSGPSPPDLGSLEDLAGSFDTLAEALALVRLLKEETKGEAPEFEPALTLLAEAQSAVRVAVNQVGYGRPDNDQAQTYWWLRTTCHAERIYVPKYMRLSDEADPGEWLSLAGRVQELDRAVRQRRDNDKEHEAALNRIRYHVGRLRDGRATDTSHDWDVVIATVDQLVQHGTPPSNTDIRELLLPLIDRVPDVSLPPNFELVLREIDRFLSTRPAPEAEAEADEATEEVKQVAQWLSGKTLVLIGGYPRLHAREALKRAFGLADVDWLETREHQSISSFESHVASPQVAAVLLAVRWSSHSFEDVRQFCSHYGKPMVRLPAGYNPNQVAVQIIEQCSGNWQGGP